ncbi:14-3-3 protein SGF14n [Spatholobus suberectus]|nr:14-3-3 protein SGF14n [Spatholobus suberectus]
MAVEPTRADTRPWVQPPSHCQKKEKPVTGKSREKLKSLKQPAMATFSKERENFVYVAKLAEQAERYDGSLYLF